MTNQNPNLEATSMIYHAYGSLAWYDADKDARNNIATRFYDCENRVAILADEETKGTYSDMMRADENKQALPCLPGPFEDSLLNKPREYRSPYKAKGSESSQKR